MRGWIIEMLHAPAKVSAILYAPAKVSAILYAPCWNSILSFVIRKPRKIIHPIFEGIFHEYRELFYVNPGAIDLLELNDEFFKIAHNRLKNPEDELIKRIMRNPALDYFIKKYRLYEDSNDLTIALRNPGYEITGILTGMLDSQMPYMHEFRKMYPLYYNPAPAWVDKMLVSDDISEIYFRGMFENPNPRVVRRVFRDFPELQQLYDSPVADEGLIMKVINRFEEFSLVWESFFSNTNPLFVNLIAKFAEWDMNSRNPMGFWFCTMLSSLPCNPAAASIYLRWTAGFTRGIRHMSTILSNPKIVQKIIDGEIRLEDYVRSSFDFSSHEEPSILAENTGLFVPDEQAWTKLVQEKASRVATNEV
jgi:hypothetical protein